MSLEAIKELKIIQLEQQTKSILKQWSTHQGRSTNYFYIDNFLRNNVAKALTISRGKGLINKE